MGEITLNEKEITIDLSAVKWGEWRKFWSGSATQKQDDAFIEKVTGLTPAEQENLLRDDYRRLVQAIVKEGREPLADPN